MPEILHEVQLNLSLTFMRNGQPKQAILHLSSLIQAKARRPAKLHYLRGKALAMTGDQSLIQYALGDLQLAKGFTRNTLELAAISQLTNSILRTNRGVHKSVSKGGFEITHKQQRALVRRMSAASFVNRVSFQRDDDGLDEDRLSQDPEARPLEERLEPVTNRGGIIGASKQDSNLLHPTLRLLMNFLQSNTSIKSLA